LLSIIQAAGWPIWPLILCSVVALALVVERALALRRMRIAPPSLVDEVLSLTRQGVPTPEMLNVLASSCVFGMVLAQGLRGILTNPRLGEAGLRQIFEMAGKHAAHQMERYLSALAAIASAAPLLGLLGTVIGMIEIFGAQTSGGGNPAQMAHGISIALYNTAFGLMVAIPSLLAWRYFRARVDGFLHEMEQGCERVVAEWLAPKPASTT